MESKYRNPLVTVDIIIEINGGIVLIERSNTLYPIVFDHGKIVSDYFRYKKGELKKDIFKI